MQSKNYLKKYGNQNNRTRNGRRRRSRREKMPAQQNVNDGLLKINFQEWNQTKKKHHIQNKRQCERFVVLFYFPLE